VCSAPECEPFHTRRMQLALYSLRASCVGDATLSEDERRNAMNRAFRQACARLELTGSPVVELVAVRILELARDGESDPDRLTDAVMATFEG
jgi:hypothetical protein